MSKNTQTSGLVNYLTHSGSIVSVSGSLTVTGSLNATAGITGSFQGVATTASYVLNAVSASYATTASYAVSASITTNAVTASYVLNAVSSSFATTAVTSSFANAFTVAGTLTATTLVVQTITSSVLYSSGSNIFGNSLSNTQVFTGSVGITGSLTLNNIAIPTSASLASNYLPLTGGTLTGALGGTSATFSNTLAVTIGGAGISLTGTVGSNSYYVMDQTPNSGGKRWRFGHTGAVAGFGSFDIYNQTDNITPFSIASTGTASFYGNVGIGGATISSMTAVSGIELVQGSQIASRILANVPQLYISSNVAGDSYAPTYKVNGYATQYRLQGYDGTHVFYTAPSGTAGNAITFTGSLTITPTGNVGIGTTSPAAFTKLQIEGTAGSQVDANQQLYITAPTTTAGQGAGIRLSAASGAKEAVGIIGVVNEASGNSGAMTFHVYNAGATVPEYMRISSGGNVGIGTNSPSAISTYTTLDVRGATGAAIRMGRTGSATPFNLQHDGTDAYLNNVANGALYFYTNDTARMTITSGGLVQINTTVGSATLNLKAQSSGSAIRLQNAATGDGTIFAYGTSTSLDYAFNTYSVGNAFYLYNNGNYDFAGSDVSDLRLKENIKTIDYNATEKLMKLVPKSYNMIKHPDIKRSGFIAQEIQQVLPDFISGKETETDYLGVDYNGILALAVKAIQEQQAQINELKNK